MVRKKKKEIQKKVMINASGLGGRTQKKKRGSEWKYMAGVEMGVLPGTPKESCQLK